MKGGLPWDLFRRSKSMLDVADAVRANWASHAGLSDTMSAAGHLSRRSFRTDRKQTPFFKHEADEIATGREAHVDPCSGLDAAPDRPIYRD